MKSAATVAITILAAALAVPAIGGGQQSVPTPAYLVHIPGVWAAEMSPDEKVMAAIIVRLPRGVVTATQIQLWDIRTDTLIRSRDFPIPAANAHQLIRGMSVRYTSDGQLLILHTDGKSLHVLRANDLEELRTLQFPSGGEITALELSPTEHQIAVRRSGDVSVFDLDSGEAVRNWSVHEYPRFDWATLLYIDPQMAGAGLAWRADGSALAISIADNPPCNRGGGTIYVFELESAAPAKNFRVPLLASSIAFGAGNRLYVATNTCGGYFTHWAMDLPLFDSASGKEVGRIPADKVGVRGYIAISANRLALVARADREKTTFEGFEDTLKVEDTQWQVWDLAAEKLALALPATEHRSVREYPKLSSSGRFIYISRPQEVAIFSVPIPAK
jgi:hypothetical protein